MSGPACPNCNDHPALTVWRDEEGLHYLCDACGHGYNFRFGSIHKGS